MPRRKTHEEYVKGVAEINPDIEVVDRYINDNTKIKHRCKRDGYEWYAKPNHILQGRGCPKCCNHIPYTLESFKSALETIRKDDFINVLKELDIAFDPEEIKKVPFANAGGLDTTGLDEEDLKELQKQVDYIKKLKGKNNGTN